MNNNFNYLIHEKESNNFDTFSPKNTISNNLDYEQTVYKKSPINLSKYKSFSNGIFNIIIEIIKYLLIKEKEMIQIFEECENEVKQIELKY